MFGVGGPENGESQMNKLYQEGKQPVPSNLRSLSTDYVLSGKGSLRTQTIMMYD